MAQSMGSMGMPGYQHQQHFNGGQEDDHVSLVSDKLPNYAKIDHFQMDPFH
jgi:hypothetical protein